MFEICPIYECDHCHQGRMKIHNIDDELWLCDSCYKKWEKENKKKEQED